MDLFNEILKQASANTVAAAEDIRRIDKEEDEKKKNSPAVNKTDHGKMRPNKKSNYEQAIVRKF